MGAASSRKPGAPSPGQRPTLASVGLQAKVSRQTVSNVLRAPERVAEDTKQRVEAVIAATGYRPSRAARALRTGRSNLIAVGLGAPDQDQVLDRFLYSLSAEAQGRGYHVLLATAADDAHEVRAYTDLLADHAVDSVILTGTHAGDARTRWLEQHGVNFVTFGRPWDSTSVHSWVDVDGASGTRQATAHLLRLGHGRVAFLGWPEGSGVGEDRRSGWEQACRAVGAPTLDLFRRMPNDLAAARSACAELLEGGKPPTGFVCVSDVIALGAWIEVCARRLVPGRDAAIVGFDDSPAAAVADLTTLAQPLDAAAGSCVDVLEARTRSPSRGPSQVLLQPTLVLRGSA